MKNTNTVDVSVQEKEVIAHMLRCIDSGWGFVHQKGAAEEVFRREREQLQQVASNPEADARLDALVQSLTRIVDAGWPHVQVLGASNSVKSVFANARHYADEYRSHYELVKHDDEWGQWFELNKGSNEIALGVKLLEDKLFEVSGNIVAYQSEFEADHVPWSLVVSVDHASINDLFASTFGDEFGKFPVIDSTCSEGLDQLIELKSKAGYILASDGDFELVEASCDTNFGM